MASQAEQGCLGLCPCANLQRFALCPGRPRAALSEPLPAMLCCGSFLDRLAGELPGPVAVPAALLSPPWPDPFSAARRLACAALLPVSEGWLG